MKTLLKVLVCFLLLSVSAEAATKTASVSGNWSNTATWGGSAVPSSVDTCLINGDIVVTVDVNTAACGATTVGFTNNTSGQATIILNSKLTITSGSNLTLGGGTSKDARWTWGPDGELNMTGSNFIWRNMYMDSTATQAHPARFTGTGAITTSGVTGPAQDINISNVIFQHTGQTTGIVLEATTGTATSRLAMDHCVWVGNAAITFGATDTGTAVNMSITNSDFRDLTGTRTVTMRRQAGTAGTYKFQHNTMVQAASLNTRSTFIWTTGEGLLIDGNVFIDAIVGNSTVQTATITNNLQTIATATAAAVVVMSDAVAGATYQYNYIYSTKDGGANLHPIQTTGSGGSGSHTVQYNILDAYSDATNDEPDMYMPGNTTTTLQTLFSNNMVIYAGEVVNGSHHPDFSAGTGILIRNNTMAGTIPAALAIPSGDIYRPELTANTGTITIRSNLHYGNNVTGEFSIQGGHTSGPQVVAYSDYNDIYNVTTPYAADTFGLTITAGNTGKTVPGSHDFTADPKFFDQRRDMAVWNGIFGSGTATRAAASTYWESLNGYRGTPNFDQGGTATAYTPRNMLDYVTFGYSPTLLTLRGAGDPTDGSLDIGAMPVRSKTTPMFAQ